MSYILRGYRCEEHGDFENLERRYSVRRRSCPTCRKLCPRSLQVGMVRVKESYAVTKGKPEERPPGTLDTRGIARRAGVDC